jgi:phosphoglycerate dehydrogenase-like enzyme
LKLVIHPPIDAIRLEKLIAAAGEMQVVNAQDNPAALREIVSADAFFGKMTPELLAASQQLRWIQSPTASLEHYLFPALVEHPATLTNMRGLFYDMIADHVFGYILMFARNLHLYLRQQIKGVWEPIGGETARSSYTAGPGEVNALDRAHIHLGDCTLGIVGLGSIGAEVAERGLAFGMRVLAVDPMQTVAPEGVEALWKLDRLGDLLAESDFVVVAAPHTPDTAGLFRRELFQQMKSSVYFINIGRGAIVPLDDLVAALQAQEIAGAALDVFETEPLPPESPLWQMPNVLITPHVAACSVRVAERHLEVLLDNVGRFVKGESLRNVVDKERWF